MKKIRYGLLALWLMMGSVMSAEAQVSIGIGLPNLSIGINLPIFPELVPVPGYPVYYAPGVEANYFFYDGMYWVYRDDNWYVSSWYNGPWGFVSPEDVPLYILRVPVRYYRQPPVYFRGWRSSAPPRWGQYWGRDWERRRRGWDRWDRRSAPSRAPLPRYQQQYSGDRYPRAEEQRSLRDRQYRYQPRDRAVRRHFRSDESPGAAVPVRRDRREEPPMRNRGEQGVRRSMPAPQPESRLRQEPAPREDRPSRIQNREQRAPDRGEGKSGRSHGEGRNKEDERGRGRNE